jgi:hypothetical protein
MESEAKVKLSKKFKALGVMLAIYLGAQGFFVFFQGNALSGEFLAEEAILVLLLAELL